ncbi:MAG: DNA recombination protein RmuC, partial [Polaribacter sp.]
MTNELIIYFLIAIICMVIGFFIGRYFSKLSFEKEKVALEERTISLQENKKNAEIVVEKLENKLTSIQLEKEELMTTNTQQDSDLKNLQLKLDENKSEVEKLQEKFTKEFENLANKILDEKSTKFTEQNKENLKTILNPLQEKIKVFEDKVDKTHKESIDYHAALRQQILG